MSSIKEYANWYPLQNQEFAGYLRKINPPLAQAALGLDLLTGDERRLRINKYNGTSSLLLTYRQKQGAVCSVYETDEDLNVVQIQGLKAKGYRVTWGMDWFKLMANQIERIATHEQSQFVRLVLPFRYAVTGLLDEFIRRENAGKRYERFANILNMQSSFQEQAYIKDLKR